MNTPCQSSSLDTLTNATEKVSCYENRIKTDYNFSYFDAYNQTAQSNNTDINACYTSDPFTRIPKLNMIPVDPLLDGRHAPQLHTYNTCKINAENVQLDRYAKHSDNIAKLQKVSGLIINAYKGSYNRNPKWFIHNSDQLFAESIMQIIDTTGPVDFQRSFEFYGFFCPHKSGSWSFQVPSNINTLVWIGDVAVNDYNITNAQIQNSNNYTSVFQAGEAYPIRIQGSSSNGIMAIKLNITVPQTNSSGPIVCNGLLKKQTTIIDTSSNATYIEYLPASFDDLTASNRETYERDFINLFYTYFNTDGTIYEKPITYFSLVETSTDNTNNGLFNCYVTNTSKETYQQLKQPASDSYMFQTVWNCYDPNDKDDAAKINATNTLYYDETKKNLMFGSNILSDQYGDNIDGGDGVISLDNNGILSTMVNGNSRQISYKNWGLDAPVPNENWLSVKQKLGFRKNIKENGTIGRSRDPIIISENGVYALFITNDGNFSILQSLDACKDKANGRIYTPTNKPYTNFYTYRSNPEIKKNKIYMVNIPDKALYNIPLNSQAISYIDMFTTPVPYAVIPVNPSEEQISGVKSNIDCANKCTSKENAFTCKYYYYDSTNETCTINTTTTGLTHIDYVPAPDTNRRNSKLYVRDLSLILHHMDDTEGPKIPNDERMKILPMVKSSDPLQYADYDLAGTLKITDTTNNIGLDGLTQDFKNSLWIKQQCLRSEGEGGCPEKSATYLNGFTNMKEGFYDHNYTESSPTITTSNAPGGPGLRTGVIQKQLNPLEMISNDYNLRQTNIRSSYIDTSANIQKIANKNKTGVRDALLKDNSKYDFGGDSFKYTTQKPLYTDALKDDINIMIYQENQLYILGSLTVAALLIGTVYFGYK